MSCNTKRKTASIEAYFGQVFHSPILCIYHIHLYYVYTTAHALSDFTQWHYNPKTITSIAVPVETGLRWQKKTLAKA